MGEAADNNNILVDSTKLGQKNRSPKIIRISEEINKIVENSNNIEKGENLFEEKFKELIIKKEIENFIINSDFSFLDKYKKEDGGINKNNFEKKLLKYFPIHSNIFFKILDQEIKTLENDNIDSVKNTIRNFIKKYLFILFIFSEKVKISDLEKFLKADINNLSVLFSVAEKDIQNLENFDQNLQEKLSKDHKIEEKKQGIKDLIIENFLPSMYRQLYREIAIEGGDEKNKGKEISNKIEKNYHISIEKLYYIFEVWIESGEFSKGVGNTDERLEAIEIVIKKLVEGIIFMKENDIAFSGFPIKNINGKFINEFEKYFLGKIDWKFKKYFIDFLNIIFEKNEENKMTKYSNLLEELKILKETIAKSKNPGVLKIKENIDIEKVIFSEWQDVPEEQKYELVFSKVIAKDGKMDFSEILKLNNNSKDFEVFVEYFAEERNIKDKEDFRESLIRQTQEILDSKGERVEDFVKKDINNLNYLILWWRFILKTRELKNEGKEISLENIKGLKERPYGLIEKIAKKLDDENIIPSDKIIFNPNGRIRNTSIKSINTLLMDLIKGLKKGFIDLSDEKIGLVSGNEKIIGKIIDLYIPAGLNNSDNSMEQDITQITSHLDYGIDVCFSILQGKKIESPYQEAYYKKVFVEKGILPEKIENFKTEDYEKLQYLVEVLKYIKNRVKNLKSMLKIATEDKKILEKDKDIKKILKEEDSCFGPDKTFNRAFIKLISSYGGNFNKLGDLTRLRIIGNDIEDVENKVVEFIKLAKESKEITHVSIVDKAGEPISLPKEKSGYRDIKLLLKLKSGNTVEVQFHFKEMFEVKSLGIDLTKDMNRGIFQKMEKESSLFTKEEVIELIKLARERNIQLPSIEIIKSLTVDTDLDWNQYSDILKDNKISTDYTYHIIRQLENSPIKRKLVRLERVLADYAWEKIVIKHLNAQNIKIN